MRRKGTLFVVACWFAVAVLGDAHADEGEQARTAPTQVVVSKRALERADVEALQQHSESRGELDALVKMLGRIRLPGAGRRRGRRRQESPSDVATAAGTGVAAGATAATTQPAASQPATTQADAGPLPLKPAGVEDPVVAVMLGDSLYRVGRYGEALGFYERVAELDAGAELVLWALLQKASCMDSLDSEDAADAYQEVARRGNDYVWGEIASVKERITRWRMREPIEEILEGESQ